MAILKEYTCASCGDFDGFIAICKKCGQTAKRAFRTAPGFPSGVAKRTDAILSKEFAKRGISNFSNVGGQNRVWVSGEGSTSSGGPPIQPVWGVEEMQKQYPTFNPNQVLGDSGKTISEIQQQTMPAVEAGTKVGSKPTALLNSTVKVASADIHGNVTNIAG